MLWRYRHRLNLHAIIADDGTECGAHESTAQKLKTDMYFGV